MFKIDEKKQELISDLVSSFHQFSQFPRMIRQKNIVQKKSEIMVLFCLKKSGKTEMRVSEISRMMNVKTPTITQLVNELEEKGQIERITRAVDRRSVWIKITESGEEVIKMAEQEMQNIFDGLINYLGEEESRHLIDSLNKVYSYFNNRINEKK